MTALRAVVFDVDGTLAETEEMHRQSFNAAFAESGLGWQWDHHLYRQLLATGGERERVVTYAAMTGQRVDATALHRRKTALYGRLVERGLVNLRPGVADLIARARQEGLRVAIGTTTSRVNVVSLLEATLGSQAIDLFDSIRTGEDVRARKFVREVYALVLSDLGLEGQQCLCIENSQVGLAAARATGMRVLITPSLFSCHDNFEGADLILRNLTLPWSSLEFRPYTSLMDQPLDVFRLLTNEKVQAQAG